MAKVGDASLLTMRPLLVASFLLVIAASVHAQDGPAEPRAPTVGQHALLVGGAVVGGLVALPLGPGAPIGVPVGTYLISHLLGLRPTAEGVLLDTVIGAAVGVGVGAATLYYITEIEGHPHDLSADFGSAFTGFVVGAAVTGLSHGVRLTLIRTPAGEQVPNLSLRIGL